VPELLANGRLMSLITIVLARKSELLILAGVALH
jgi:hypothetical protein